MRKLTQWYRLAAVAAVVGTLGCKSLEVTNPNAPDANRAFSDPGAVAGLITGAMRNWFSTRTTYYGAEVLTAMADSYTSSWNNMNNRFYSSYGPVGNFQANCPQRCGWDNTPSGPSRLSLEGFWYGYYGMLSSVNDVLNAIRVKQVDLGGVAATKMHEAVAVMLQGVVYAGIATNYDKGFVVGAALSDSVQRGLVLPTAIPFRPRAEMRDSAVSTFNQAIALMTATPFAASPTTWTGAVNGTGYSSAQFIRLIRTMQAEVLALFARNAAENSTTNWAQVTTFASQGISSGASFDFNFYQDVTVLYDWVKAWGNAYGDMRVDTRVAHIITAGPDPSRIFSDPWPGHAELQPNAFDKRVGNGTWGPDDEIDGGTIAADAGAGSDYAYMPANHFNQSRGPYHNSNLGHIRYSYLASPGSGLPGEDGRGQDPFFPATHNDLLWAEGLLRGGGSAVTAANLINKTRVTRGGLATLTGAETNAALISALLYEQEIEEMGNAAVPFYNRRRQTPEGWQLTQACPGILCLWPQTPRHMPVPAKELSVLQQELYTFGGPADPDLSPSFSGGNVVWSAKRIGDAILKAKVPGMVTRKF